MIIGRQSLRIRGQLYILGRTTLLCLSGSDLCADLYWMKQTIRL